MGIAADAARQRNGDTTMNAMVWETNDGKWDVIVDGAMTRLTCYATEAEATQVIADLGWYLLSVIRLI